MESESSVSQSSTVTSEVKVSEVSSSSASSTMQEFGQSLSSQDTEDDKIKMMMTGQLEGSTVSESSSSVMSVQKSSSSSQSTSKVSMSTESSGDSEPTVVSKVEESCEETSASSASQVHIVDGEVKSSLEEARQEKAVAVRRVETEDGLVREEQAASQQAAAVLGEICIYLEEI